MDVLSLSKIRVQVLQQVFPSGEEPIDIVFCMIGDNLTMSPIEVNGGFSPSKKRDMRIKVLNLFLNKENPDLRWRKRSIPTHSGWLYPLTFDAEKGLKEA